MGLIRQKRWKLGIFLALWDISSGPPMGQFAAAQDTANGAEGGKWLGFDIDHFPLDGLIAAEESLVVQVQSNHFHDLFDLRRSAEGAGKRPSRPIFKPGWII
jgi:hypothetical protein